MFDSVFKDIRYELTRGNTVTKLILINIGVFIVFLLAKVIMTSANGGTSEIFDKAIQWFSVPASFENLISQPWSLITYAFIHISPWQILYNMLLLYWFGAIAGDLIGDKRIFPIYLYGAIIGGLFAMLCVNFIPIQTESHKIILGASASVMAILFAAATLAPDYLMRLIIIGTVRIKFIVLALLLIDILSISFNANVGNSYARIGGALAGFLFIYVLRKGYDPSKLFHKRNKEKRDNKRRKNQKSKIISIFDTIKKNEMDAQSNSSVVTEHRLDLILEKIKKSGRQSLTADELEFLEKISRS